MSDDAKSNFFTRFEHEGKTYLQTGTFQLFAYGMCERKHIFAEPAILNAETQAFVNEHGIVFGDSAITGMPTFIFDTPEKLGAFEEKYQPVYKSDD